MGFCYQRVTGPAEAAPTGSRIGGREDSPSAHSFPGAPLPTNPIPSLLDCTRLLHAAAADAAPWEDVTAALQNAARTLARDTNWEKIAEVIHGARDRFDASSALRADPEVLAALIPPEDVYHRLSGLLPQNHDAITPISDLLECNILQAMENRLSLLHATMTAQHFAAAVEHLAVATLTVNADGHIRFVSRAARDLLGMVPLQANDLARLLPPVATWLRHLQHAPPNGVEWEPAATVQLGQESLIMFGLRVSNPVALHLFLERSGTYHAVATAARARRLTPREEDVLKAVVAGQSNAAIAADLGISADTVKLHVSRLLQKFHVRRRTDLVRHVLSAPAHIAPLSPLTTVSASRSE